MKLYSEKNQFRLILLLYVIAGICVLPLFRYQINPDGISYINNAWKYIQGDFMGAVNGHWSPLYSWLLIPFFVLGIEPLLSTKLLAILIGALSLIGSRLLINRFDIDEKFKTVFLLPLGFLYLYFGIAVASPDLLMACILLFYFSIIFKQNYHSDIKNGIFCGILGVLLFLSKAYGFYFFLFHFLFVNLFHYLKHKNKNIVKNFITGLFVFGALSIIWIIILSGKYDKLTISTAGEYNRGIYNQKKQLQHPINSNNLYGPLNSTAISIWDDPAYFKLEQWSPFESKKNFIYQMNLIYKHTIETIKDFTRFSLFAIPLLIGWFIYLCIKWRNIFSHGTILLTFFSIALYCGGFLLLIIQIRYIWIASILIYFMGAGFLNLIFKNKIFTLPRRIVSISILILSFLVFPIKNFRAAVDNGKDVFQIAEKIKVNYPLTGNVASYRNWNRSLFLCYHLKISYYGELKYPAEFDEMQEVLKNHKIKYFLIWGNYPEVLEYYKDYREVTDGQIQDLRIFELH